MEKRIKIIYGLTIVAIIAMITIQGYWLYNQYGYTLRHYEDELYQKTIEIIAKDRAVRRKLQNNNLHALSQWQMSVLRNELASQKLETTWTIDVYIVDKNQVRDSVSLQQADSLSSLNTGVEKHTFVVSESNRQTDIHDAIELFTTNKLHPFRVKGLDSLLMECGLKALSIKTENIDSVMWNPKMTRHSSIFNPTMEVAYPIDILQKTQLEVLYKLNVSPILSRMIGSLIGSIAISLLLVFCLIYQIKTIRKQQRIEELRRSFIKTMIHELKRPLSALKMCVSFMKNEKMIQDSQMKEDIINNSENELDNLSSYFSKLRDMTYGDTEEIPLNLSTFNVKELVEKCIKKQSLPTDRRISITAKFDDETTQIIADKMHLSNIVSNLIENAVKYSEGETFIEINCFSINGVYKIEVLDNGLGIDPSELPYIFDRYFRSASIAGKEILGIGLGLSYVRLLVNAHRGQCYVKSTLGIGSKFTIEIPKK